MRAFIFLTLFWRCIIIKAMIKIKSSKEQPNISQEFRRLGVLIEHVDEAVGLIAEQQTGIKKDIWDIQRTLDSHTEMIGGLAVDLVVVKEDIAFIKNSLKKKVDYDEFAALERRVLLLEKHR